MARARPAPPVEAHHRKAESLPLIADPVVGRDAAVVELDHGGGLALPTHLAFIGSKRKARGSLLHNEGRNALGTALAAARHHQIDVGNTGAGDEGLAAVEHIAVAVAPSRGAHRGGVGA